MNDELGAKLINRLDILTEVLIGIQAELSMIRVVKCEDSDGFFDNSWDSINSLIKDDMEAIREKRI